MPTEFPSTDYVTFPVSGATLVEVAEEIMAWPEAGRCEWFPAWNSDADGTVTVQVPTRITLPDWTACESATDQERHEWRHFMDALARHEEHHLSIVRAELDGLAEALEQAGASEMQVTFDDALRRLQDRSDAFDASSDHGRNDGTVLNL